MSGRTETARTATDTRTVCSVDDSPVAPETTRVTRCTYYQTGDDIGRPAVVRTHDSYLATTR